MNDTTIPTGIPDLDLALGVGGLPRGRIIEIFGPKRSGKTALAIQFIAACQQQGGVAAFVDMHHALPLAGPDLAKLLVAQPDCGEEAVEIVESLVKAGIDLIVVDSVGGLLPRAELAGEVEPAVGIQARLLSFALRRLAPLVHRLGCTVVFVNPVGPGLDSFGRLDPTAGGRALRFYASVRMDVRRTEGRGMRVKVVKNKVAPPHTVAEFDLGT